MGPCCPKPTGLRHLQVYRASRDPLKRQLLAFRVLASPRLCAVFLSSLRKSCHYKYSICKRERERERENGDGSRSVTVDVVLFHLLLSFFLYVFPYRGLKISEARLQRGWMEFVGKKMCLYETMIMSDRNSGFWDQPVNSCTAVNISSL